MSKINEEAYKKAIKEYMSNNYTVLFQRMIKQITRNILQKYLEEIEREEK